MQDSSWITLMSSVVSNLGFPIVVAGFLLLRVEKKLEALNHAVLELQKELRDDRNASHGKK
ncbi:YvrJ family protein [Paenibacillus sp. F411]|uniref:YvrJ family protein n=1 Tax=Paenibacillus algicola TaxID=2565926 RepID=A0A4P8XQJ2_9BACL|nr:MULTISPECIES: YvrJ family protein [Paenibacillus]MBO2943822.1 YvrJ family protein [Paenibacillus sp. F411]QCT04110.1 hypothetical protein E6C60_3399 [Paenibacillus algicola]